jgi:hypothetical protein
VSASEKSEGRRHGVAKLPKLTLQNVQFLRALELENWNSVAEPGVVVRSQPDRHNPALLHLSVCDADDATEEFATCVFNTRLSSKNTMGYADGATAPPTTIHAAARRVGSLMGEHGGSSTSTACPVVSPSNLYSQFATSGFAYGHQYRRVVELARHADSAVRGEVLGHASQQWSLIESAAVIDACTQIASLVRTFPTLSLPSFPPQPFHASSWCNKCIPVFIIPRIHAPHKSVRVNACVFSPPLMPPSHAPLPHPPHLRNSPQIQLVFLVCHGRSTRCASIVEERTRVCSRALPLSSMSQRTRP